MGEDGGGGGGGGGGVLYGMLLAECPGYCGRVPEEGRNLTSIDCGLCPRAHRSDGFVCLPCDDHLKPYSIAFIVLELLVVAGFFAEPVKTLLRSTTPWKARAFVFAYTVLEFSLAIFCTLLSLEPKGSLRVHSCGMSHINDWYPVFFNPKPDSIHELHCANEVAFPLITFFLLFLGFLALSIITIRIPLLVSSRVKHAMEVDDLNLLSSTWSLLYAAPLLALAHIALGGLLYYAFPFIVFAVFLVLCARAALTGQGAHAFKGVLRSMWSAAVYYILPFGALYCMRELFGADNPLHWVWIALGPLLPAIIIQSTWWFTHPDRF